MDGGSVVPFLYENNYNYYNINSYIVTILCQTLFLTLYVLRTLNHNVHNNPVCIIIILILQVRK